MNTANNKVNKMFSPEEAAVVTDLANQLLSMAQQGGSPEQDMNQQMEAAKGNDTAAPEEDHSVQKLEAIKAIITGGGSAEDVEKALAGVKENPQGTTARDTGEQRVEPETIVNDANAADVKKSYLQGIELAMAIMNKTPAQAVQTPAHGNGNDLAQMVEKALAPITAHIENQNNFNNAIMKSFGLADSIERSVNAQTHQPVITQTPVVKSQGVGGLPIGNIDAQALADQIVNNMNGRSNEVAKSGDALIAQFDPLKKFDTPLIQRKREGREILAKSFEGVFRK